MTAAQTIELTLNTLPEGIPFGYQDLRIAKGNFQKVAVALSRLEKQGIIQRFQKGVYYKPRHGAFGELGIQAEELIQTLLYKKGKRIGYLTGLGAYNRLGFSTQVSATLEVGVLRLRPKKQWGNWNVRYVQAYTQPTGENVEWLVLLDAIKDQKRFDLSSQERIAIFKALLQKYADSLDRIISLAILYPPMVRAFLGALLETEAYPIDTVALRESLNPLTTYKLGYSETELPTRKKWNIV
jgi:hypothetical protein